METTLNFVNAFPEADIEPSTLMPSDWDFLDELLSSDANSNTFAAPLGPESHQVSSSSSKAGRASKQTRKPKKPRYNPNHARSERSCEVRFLREKVTELEQRLCLLQQRAQKQTLHSVIDQEESQGTVSVDKARISSEVSGMWKEITSHQRHRRELTERENVRLKFMAETQRKVMANLRALLKKQLAEYIQIQNRGHLGRVMNFHGDIGEFQELFQQLDMAYYKVDHVFAANYLPATEILSGDVHVRRREDGKHLDLFSNRVFPFSLQDTAEASWNYGKGEEKHSGNGGLYEKTAKNLDQPYTIVEDFTKELFSNNSRADIKVKHIVRRYVEIDRDIVIFVASVTPIQIKHKEIPGLTYHFRNYAVTRRSPLSTPEEEMSSLQLCSCISIGDGPDTLYDPRHLRSVANFATGTIETSIQTYLERMEDALVDRSLLRKR